MDKGTPSVELAEVSKRFGDFTAVRELDLALDQGEFFTLLGPSGCGKTTTLRMIAGFEQPSEGQILIEGANVAGSPPHKRPTNTVFQSYALFPHLNVEDNVAFGLRRKGVDKAEAKKRVAAELERVGLAADANRRPAQLSGGMQQRVALARALVNLPKVLLLDEPLGALDLKLRKGLQVELKRIQREVGITFVYVTHDQEEALTMSDRIAVMNHGEVEQVSGPVDVYERPTTTFVAGFIGVSNLMPATIEAGGSVQLERGPRLDADTSGFTAGERCHAVVRPEKLDIEALSEGGGTGERPHVEGTVESAVYLGTATQMIVDLGEGVRMTVLCPNSSEAERQALPGAGVRVSLSWEPQHMHLVRESQTKEEG
jgi:spermidine/putrescine transport system ATP-binding protein